MPFLNILFVLVLGSDILPLKTFKDPTGDEYLSMPHASYLASDGRLYVMDPGQPRILVWKANGEFEKGFARKGEGPGELDQPIQITCLGNQVLIWQRNGRVSRFSSDGVYIDNFTINGPWPRRFAMLNADTAFINYREIGGEKEAFYIFEVRHRDGKTVEIKRDKNIGFLDIKPGSNNVEVRAYMADVDIQLDPQGGYWYGFGYEKTLYHMDAKGHLDGKRSFELPLAKPSAEDQEYLANKEVVVSDGSRIRLRELPNLKIHFDYDTAYFTQFMIKGERVAFILTSTGGTDGGGDGDSRASYRVCDLKSGKLLARGAYELPQDSQVHFRDGHILAFTSTDDGYIVQEISLKGL